MDALERSNRQMVKDPVGGRMRPAGAGHRMTTVTTRTKISVATASLSSS